MAGNEAYDFAVLSRKGGGSRSASPHSTAGTSGWHWQRQYGRSDPAQEERGREFAKRWKEAFRKERRKQAAANKTTRAETMLRDFRDAANVGDDDMVADFLAAGFDPNTVLHPGSGSAAIHFAAKEGHASTCELLLRGGMRTPLPVRHTCVCVACLTGRGGYIDTPPCKLRHVSLVMHTR